MKFGGLHFLHRAGPAATAASPESSYAHSFAPTLPYHGPAIDAAEACTVMVEHLHSTIDSKYFKGKADLAAAVRIDKHDYALFPALADAPHLAGYARALDALDVDVALYVKERMVQTICNSIPAGSDHVSLSELKQVQVVETVADLADARAAQRACFIRTDGSFVLWSDDAASFPAEVALFKEQLVSYVWRHSNSLMNKVNHVLTPPPPALRSNWGSPNLSRASSHAGTPYLGTPALTSLEELDEKLESVGSIEDGAGFYSPAGPEIRGTPIQGALLSGASLGLAVLVSSLSIKTAMQQYFLDLDVMHFPILVAVPFMFLVSLFFCSNVIGVLTQLFAPTYYRKNTSFYSGVAPIRRPMEYMPHMTIVIPVYKESLGETVAPSIESINTAIRTYELQGGTANLIVCDDGLQLIDEEERAIRTEYYERRGAAFVARPKENRAGRFKKSSNMNTMHKLSLEIERAMNEQRPAELAGWTPVQEAALYEACLAAALDAREGKIWAKGNLRIGEYILLVDSDTRIPEDCFLDAALEMEASPEVGILQYCSGTFLAGAGFFENGIAFFTKIVNFSISITVSNGILAPFMGHNAFLRWSAMQEQALTNPDNLIWSEEHVSEDFVMTMCLVEAGYTIRWATYTQGFLEGVSLSAADELNRWQKYAFGVSEVCMNPVRYWFTRLPVSKLFRRYLMGPAPLSAKFASVAYLTSYVALACGGKCSLS